MQRNEDISAMSDNETDPCPVCKRKWPTGCEQAIAVEKRGKCIVCLIANDEHIEMNPYEFQTEKEESE